jgi:hypothetical protein
MRRLQHANICEANQFWFAGATINERFAQSPRLICTLSRSSGDCRLKCLHADATLRAVQCSTVQKEAAMRKEFRVRKLPPVLAPDAACDYLESQAISMNWAQNLCWGLGTFGAYGQMLLLCYALN